MEKYKKLLWMFSIIFRDNLCTFRGIRAILLFSCYWKESSVCQ